MKRLSGGNRSQCTKRAAIRIAKNRARSCRGCDRPATDGTARLESETEVPDLSRIAFAACNNARLPAASFSIDNTEFSMHLLRRLPHLLVLSLLAYSHAGAQSVTFGARPPATGQKTTSTGSAKMTMDLHVEADGEAQDVVITNERNATWRETVLAVSDSQATLRSVVYDAFEEKNENPMEQEAATFAPVVGREYVVDRTDTVTVTARDGSPLPDSEKNYLRDHYLRVTFDEGFSSYIRMRPFRTGEKTVIDKELASTIFDAIRDEKGVKEFTVTLRELRTVENAECGVFDIVLKVSTEMGPLAMDMDITGEAVMRVADSRAVSFQFKGPIQMAANDAAFAVTGGGEFRVSLSNSYSAE
jgi:hypothetical protein